MLKNNQKIVSLWLSNVFSEFRRENWPEIGERKESQRKEMIGKYTRKEWRNQVYQKRKKIIKWVILKEKEAKCR